MINFFTLLTLKGDNVLKFCHDYTVSSFLGKEVGSVVPTAFLNKKGRVVATVIVFVDGRATLSLLLPTEVKTQLLDHLSLYLKFSKIDYEISQPSQDFSEFIDLETVLDRPIPWIGAHSSALFTPSDLSLDNLKWVDFDKGCYLGQEVVSRMHFKVKKKKKFLALVEGDNISTVLPSCYDSCEQTLAVINDSVSHSQPLVTVHQAWDKDPR